MEPSATRAASDSPSSAPVRFWKIAGGRLDAAVARATDLFERTFPGERTQTTLTFGAHLLTLGITTYVFLVLNKRFYYTDQSAYDEQFFAWGGWCITKGLAPYRDFLEFKPPMVFITHAWAQDLFGFKNLGFRKFFTLFPLASVLLLQASLIARGVGRWLATVAILGIVVLFVNPSWHDTALTDCESIGLSYFMLGLAALLWEGRYMRQATVLGGIFMACCVFSKEPFAPVVGLTWLSLFWLRGKPAPSRESARLYAVYSLLGVAVFLAALCVYMIPNGAMRAYLALVRSYSAIYRDPKRSYCAAVGVYHPPTALADLRLYWDKIRLRFLNTDVLGYFLPIVIPGTVFIFRRSWLLFCVTVVGFVGALWAFTATGCRWPHYFNMSMAGVILVVVASVDSMKDGRSPVARLVRWGACLVAWCLLISHSHEYFAQQRALHLPYRPWVEPIPGVVEFIKQHTTPADRIFTTGPPLLYPKVDRLSAVRESNIIDEILGSYEGTTDQQKLQPIREELLKNRPKVVVLDPEHAPRKVRHNRALMMPFLKELNYQKINESVYLRPD